MSSVEPFGYKFINTNLLLQALTHKSYFNENGKLGTNHNETLEFLGDAVLDLVLAHFLMKTYPTLEEGALSKLRASLVNEVYLAQLSKEMGIEGQMLLGKGEKLSGGAAKPRLLASTFEALIGALFLDAGYERSVQVIEEIYRPRLESLDLSSHFHLDYKTRLQEKVQRELKTTPEYELAGEKGPDHDKTFFVKLKVGDQIVASGEGRSKKQAEQEAARIGLEIMP